jgi:hypothetical protein
MFLPSFKIRSRDRYRSVEEALLNVRVVQVLSTAAARKGKRLNEGNPDVDDLTAEDASVKRVKKS